MKQNVIRRKTKTCRPSLADDLAPGIAKEEGIAQFHAEVLQENRGMLAVFKRSGFPMKQESAEGIVHVTLSLRGERSDE